MNPMDNAWVILKYELPDTYRGTTDEALYEQSGSQEGQGPDPNEQLVQELHKGLSIATTAAEELGLDDIAAQIVQLQSEVEEHYPGSEDTYYRRS